MTKYLKNPIIASILAITTVGPTIANADNSTQCVACTAAQSAPKIVFIEEVKPVSDCLNDVTVITYKDSCKVNCGDFPVLVRKTNCCSGTSSCNSK
jgi:hypothetical protein